ncbi:MAG: hypothetical protein MUF22_08120 [Chitinispirillaceae bacterium]|nr:hypothetical protein [Chitinispirillaceae bacterium]
MTKIIGLIGLMGLMGPIMAGDIPAAQNETQIASVVAVVPFSNSGSLPRFAPLATGLADMVITDLSQVKALSVVERVKVSKLVAELNLEGTAGINRVSTMLSANQVISGSYACKDTTAITISGSIVDAKTGVPLAMGSLDGPLKDFFGLEKKFVFSVVDKMGIKLTDDERVRIQKIPTENLLAFLAYSQGLEASDKGDVAGAKAAFAKAAKLDPMYKAAVDRTLSGDEALRPDAQPAAAPVVMQSSGPAAAAPTETALISDNKPEASAGADAEIALEPAAKNTAAVSPSPNEVPPQVIPVLAPAEPAAEAPARLQETPAPAAERPLFNAGSDMGLRAATLTQAGFMPELAVPAPSPAPAVAGTSQASEPQPQPLANNVSDMSTPYTRPPFADSHNLALDSKKEISILVELPEVPR